MFSTLGKIFYSKGVLQKKPRSLYMYNNPRVVFLKKKNAYIELKVVWDTLQYFQGWQDSKKWLQQRF